MSRVLFGRDDASLRIPPAEGFNRQNVKETGNIQCSLVWKKRRPFLLLSEDFIWNGCQFFRWCLWLGSPLFQHTRRGVWRQRTARKSRKKCGCVCSQSSQRSSTTRPWLKRCKDAIYFTEHLTHMILNHFQSTIADAILCVCLTQMQTHAWRLNLSQLWNDEKYMCTCRI